MKYEKWIGKHSSDIFKVLGRCQSICTKMVAEFPELRITNGFVKLDGVEEQQTHWWCVDPDNNIVDPTAFQYVWNNTPILQYIEIDDDHPARKYPRRKCMNCGKYFFDGPGHKEYYPCCDKKCLEEYTIYVFGEKNER